jgi:uncharacterized protein
MLPVRMMSEAILWRRLDTPGHEACRVAERGTWWSLAGAAAFLHEGRVCRLDYEVICDPVWETRIAKVSGWVGSDSVDVEISVDAERRWWIGGVERPEVAGCVDVDLNFSPSTNLLPIRRLALEVGREAEVRAAWLRFPTFTLELLDQRYRRTSETVYRYESGGGAFTADLRVNAAGFPVDYAVWRAEL